MSQTLEIFRALADPTRLRIVTLLRTMELSVGELAQVLGQSQPRVSRHVKILCDAGLAERRKEGSWVFLVPGSKDHVGPVFGALDQWNANFGVDHWEIADSTRLAAVHADRARNAERYFADKAEHWDSIRALHIGDAEVEAAIAAMLQTRPLGRFVDIGTGTGRMLELFADEAISAIGIDRSPDMLRVARGKLSAAGRTDCELRQGDVMALSLPDGCAETVLIHQVLHYIPAPENALAEAARILAPGGRLLVIDFAPHDHEELRTQDAHARLGFSDTQMKSWLEALGLSMTKTIHLEGGALTISLWLGERRDAAADTKTRDERIMAA
jgi:ubiquinone/menaquinone biosynthesis C-methylase UbiE/DNA-binding transcriptional ArsR family regulator